MSWQTISAINQPSFGHLFGQFPLAFGYHDSIEADGAFIRSEREDRKLSREALVEISGKAFSTKTLVRAEKGVAVSKEKLIAIARALDLPDMTFILNNDRLASSGPDVITIHHWEDEPSICMSYVMQLCYAIGSEYDDEETSAAWKVCILRSRDNLGFDVRYVIYDRMAHFEEAMHRSLMPQDIVVLDVMNVSGIGNLSSGGLKAFVDLENVLDRERTVFLTAAQNILDMAGLRFDDIKRFNKAVPDEFLWFLKSAILDFSNNRRANQEQAKA